MDELQLHTAVLQSSGSDINVSATAFVLNHCINFSLLLSMEDFLLPKSVNDVTMEFIRS